MTRNPIHIAVTFMLLLCCIQLPGQNLSKYYSTLQQEMGDLYFIFPFEDFKNISNQSDFVFDITFLEGNDSATINFTWFSDEPLKADSLHFMLPENKIQCHASRLFQDYQKNLWQSRNTTKIAFEELGLILNSQKAPEIVVITNDRKMRYAVKPKKWLKWQNAMEKVFYIISLENQ